MIYAIIIACEIGFWVFIILGLVARYLLRKPRLGAALLIMAPLTDVVLLTVTAIDLHSGGTATFGHALAAFYLGLSIVYGHRTIRWADVRFAHRFADGPAPVKLYGRDYTVWCWQDFLRCLLAMAITAGILGLLIVIAGDPERSQELYRSFGSIGVILVIWLIIAISYTLWPRKEPQKKS